MKNILLFAILLSSTFLNAQGIGVNEDGSAPDASAILDVKSTDKGFLPPRMTTTERDAINGGDFEEGLIIYNLDVHCLQWWNGTGWFDGCDKGLTAGPESDCPFIPPYLTASETVVKDVINPVTGKIWMDRNLGAYNAARSSTDCWAYGNLYQWGRAGDGHEYRNSEVHHGNPASNRPSTITESGPWDGKFIRINDNTNRNDWVQNQTNDAWNEGTQAAPIKTATDPCPSGYRVPTSAELNAELNSWNSSNAAGAFNSPLKLPVAGSRNRITGELTSFVGERGRYWSGNRTGTGSNAWRLSFFNGASMNLDPRAIGSSVRCIKE